MRLVYVSLVCKLADLTYVVDCAGADRASVGPAGGSTATRVRGNDRDGDNILLLLCMKVSRVCLVRDRGVDDRDGADERNSPRENSSHDGVGLNDRCLRLMMMILYRLM